MIMILCRYKDGGEPGILFTTAFYSKDEFEARNPAWQFVECHTVEGYFISDIHSDCIFTRAQDEGNGTIYKSPAPSQIVETGGVSAQNLTPSTASSIVKVTSNKPGGKK